MYCLVSIERIPAPCGGAGGYWYRYVISNNHGNTITGQRSGSRKDVRRFALDCITHLNQKYRHPATTNSRVRPINIDAMLPLYR